MLKQKRYLFSVAVLLLSFLMPSFAGATQLTQAGVRLGRLGISATANNDVLVTFKLNTTPTSVAKIRVLFPVGFTITTGTPTIATTGFPNTPASITAPPGSLTAVATAGTKDIVVSGLTSASLSGSTLYGFIIPSGTVQNPGSAGQYNPSVISENAGSTPLDTTLTPTYIYGASPNQDQITVNASVAPNFTFSLSANSDTVPTVDSTTVQTSPGVNMIVATNSPLGYTAYVKSGSATGLTSATSPSTPIATGTFDGSPDSVTAGTNKYTFVPSTGAAASQSTGVLTYDGEYNGITASTGGSFNGTSFASFVSRNGSTSGDTISLKERVAVSTTIGYANDYTDTLTVVAAGNY